MATKNPALQKTLTKVNAKNKPSTVVATCEVLPPEKALTPKSATVHFSKSASVHFCSSEQLFVAGLKEDMDRACQHMRTSAFLALRIGLRLIYYRDNAPHGALEPFLKKHFAQSRRSLFNYIKVADGFLEDTGLRNKRSHLLTDGSRIAPIVEKQLELFTDPKKAAKADAIIKKAVKWVKDRSLNQIYRDLAEEEDSSLPPSRKGKKPEPRRNQREIDEEDLLNAYHTFRTEWEESKAWQGLDDEVLAEMDTFLALARKETLQLLKERK